MLYRVSLLTSDVSWNICSHFDFVLLDFALAGVHISSDRVRVWACQHQTDSYELLSDQRRRPMK